MLKEYLVSRKFEKKNITVTIVTLNNESAVKLVVGVRIGPGQFIIGGVRFLQ